jgi:Flp pilus assembly protein TadG
MQFQVVVCIARFSIRGGHAATMKTRLSFSTLRRFRRENNGTTAIEFAMLAPLFILLLLGMVAYGVYFGASHSVQQIAADAARTAISGLNQQERQSLVDGFVQRNAGGYPFIDPQDLSVSAQDSNADASQFVVSVRYDARGLPIWNLLSDLPLPATVIARQSTIRIGGL